MPLADYSDKEVRKRGKPELNERWWKQAWPGEKASKHAGRMTKAIKAYKVAKRGTVASDLVKSLDELLVVTKALKSDAASTLKSTPKRKKAITDDLDKLDGLIDAEKKAAGKFGSKTREVFRYDFAARVTEALKSDDHGKRMKFAGSMVKIELLEAIVQELDSRNALNSLYAEYSNALDERVDGAAAELCKLGKQRAYSNDDQTTKMAQKILDKHAATLADLHHKAPTNVIKKLGLHSSMEAQYQKELKKRRIAIAKSTVLTTASGVAIALPGTQAFAIYGFARSAAGLAQQLVEHNLKITQAATLLGGHLTYLKKAFKSGAKRAASETGGTTLNAVLGIDLVPTLDKATASLKDLKVNTGHASFKVQKLTDEIMKMMDGCKDLGRTVDSLPKDHKYYKKLSKNLARNESQLDGVLKKTASLGKQLNTVERKLPTLSKTLKDLGKNSKSQDFANYTAKAIVNLTAIAGGGLVDATAATTAAGSAIEGSKEIAAMMIAGTGYANELVDTAKEVRDLGNK